MQRMIGKKIPQKAAEVVMCGMAAMLLAIPARSASHHSGRQPATMIPPRGEIRLEGTVQSVTATRRIILSVSTVTQANGEWVSLNPQRIKQIVLREQTFPHLRGKPNVHIKLDDLAYGTKAIVMAADTGVGKDTVASDVAVWTGYRHGAYEFQKPID